LITEFIHCIFYCNSQNLTKAFFFHYFFTDTRISKLRPLAADVQLPESAIQTTFYFKSGEDGFAQPIVTYGCLSVCVGVGGAHYSQHIWSGELASAPLKELAA
jgi:hypothetical protein